jgi:hypothetical protein
MTRPTSVLLASLVVTANAFAGEEAYDESLLATDAFREAWEALDWEGALSCGRSARPCRPTDRTSRIQSSNLLSGLRADRHPA